MTTENTTSNETSTTTNSSTNSTETPAAVVETPVLSKFDINTTEKALALYLDAKAGREAIEQELVEHELYMSSICKDISAKFGNGPFDLGDGNPRGHIIVKRGDLFFIRGRNSGRPVGSGKKAVQADVAAVPAALAAVLSSTDDEDSAGEAELAAEKPVLSAMDQAIAVAEAEIAEQEAARQSAE